MSYHDTEVCMWCSSGDWVHSPKPDYPDAHASVGKTVIVRNITQIDLRELEEHGLL